MWLLWLLTRRRSDNRMLAYYDGGAFVGFTCTVETEKYRYISFIAVSEALRNKGSGSLLLAELKAQTPRRALLVEVESPNPQTQDAALRQRRKNFYIRNGFMDTGRHINNRGVDYDILSTAPEFDPAEYWEIFDRMSLGLRDGIKRLAHSLLRK